jgi:hypothetical protein
MAQPEENREKTDDTNDVLLSPGGDPHRSTAELPPRDPPEEGETRVEQDGQMVRVIPEDDV